MKQKQRDYEGDIIYQVWRSGGNPDAISPDRLDDYYYNDVAVDDAARIEIRRQRRQESYANAET